MKRKPINIVFVLTGDQEKGIKFLKNLVEILNNDIQKCLDHYGLFEMSDVKDVIDYELRRVYKYRHHDIFCMDMDDTKVYYNGEAVEFYSEHIGMIEGYPAYMISIADDNLEGIAPIVYQYYLSGGKKFPVGEDEMPLLKINSEGEIPFYLIRI